MASASWRGFPFARVADDDNNAGDESPNISPTSIKAAASNITLEPPPPKKKKFRDARDAVSVVKHALQVTQEPRATAFAGPPKATSAPANSSRPAAASSPRPVSMPVVSAAPEDTIAAEPSCEPLAPKNLRRIAAGRMSVTPGWLRPALVARLRADAEGLHGAGVFTAGALGGRGAATGVGKSTRLCDVCGLFDDAPKAKPSVGDPAAREELFEALSGLRAQLEAPLEQGGTGRPLAEHVELQYLRYPGAPLGSGAGFYGRHVDQQAVDLGHMNNRSVSLLLYLNGPDWDPKVDGGALVAYPKATVDRPAKPEEVSPVGGTLVLFDSVKLEHEAMPTRRVRWALVGWFMQGSAGGKAVKKGWGATATAAQTASRALQRKHRIKMQTTKKSSVKKKVGKR